MTTHSKHIVISLGGSLIIPDTIDVAFLQSFKTLIEKLVAEGYHFTLFTGGGAICRTYLDALEKLKSPTSRDEKDWVGISITHVNALLLRTMFGDLAHHTIVTNPNDVPETDKPIVVGAGWKPGWSTDYDAVVYAKNIGTARVINISNISHVYTKDPRTNPDAEKIEMIDWTEFRKLIPESWEAGLHSPFDPVASRSAEDSGITVCILDGRNTSELENAIRGVGFVGTQITP